MMSGGSHPPRANFPLPRELRDLIYGHILDSLKSREMRLKGSKAFTCFAGRADQFHTNILGVNHAIHDESQYTGINPINLWTHLLIMGTAEEYLYKNNVFVSFEWPEFYGVVEDDLAWSQSLYSPIITDIHVARMKHHTVRLHVIKNMQNPIAAPSADQPSKIPVQAILLLAVDFDAFCVSLRSRVGALRGFAVVVEDDVGPTNELTLFGVTKAFQKIETA